MKICCEKCHRDISNVCNGSIESYRVGRIVCPECGQKQKRYISEADILLFFGVSEVFYILLSLLTVWVFGNFGLSLISGIILLAMLTGSYFASKALSSSIYEKAFFKSEIKNRVFEEDAASIQKSIGWQFMLFFAITITYITTNEGRIFFALAMPLCALLTFIKLYFQLRYEKSENKQHHM